MERNADCLQAFVLTQDVYRGNLDRLFSSCWHGWVFLVVCRFLVGFGVTGLYTVDIAVVQEFVPASKRGWVTGVTTTMLPAGFILGALLGQYADHTEARRRY